MVHSDQKMAAKYRQLENVHNSVLNRTPTTVTGCVCLEEMLLAVMEWLVNAGMNNGMNK